MSFWTSLKNIWSKDISPFVASVVKSEVRVLVPIAKEAIASLTIGELSALRAGGKDTGHVLAQVVRDTSAKAANAGLDVAASSILTAVGTAVNKVN